MLSTIESMSDQNARADKRMDTDVAQITDLSDLEVGDTILFGDHSKPLTVVDTAQKRDYSPALDEELYTPTVLVRGDWKNAKPYALAHRVSRITETNGQYDPALEPLDEIVAVVGQKATRGTWDGTLVDVVRVERAGPDCDVDGSDTEVVV